MREPTYQTMKVSLQGTGKRHPHHKTSPPFQVLDMLRTPVSALSLEHTIQPEVLEIQASALPALYAFSDTNASIPTAGTDQSVPCCGLH